MKWYQLDIDTVTPEEYARAYALLAPEEQERVDRFRFADDKKRTLAGMILARRGLSIHCGIPEEGIVFEREELGKPFAPGLAAEFSVSHSGRLAICAVDDQPIGIDIEQLRPVSPQVAQRICTDEELAWLALSPDDAQWLQRFFRLWTGKEACAKRDGLGIANLQHYRPLETPGILYETLGDYILCICSTPGR